jgi:hypothetical protein
MPSASSGRHSVPTHSKPGEQSAGLAHEVRQSVAPHAYGSHETAEGTVQLPEPLHVPAGVASPAAHVGSEHCVSAEGKVQAVLLAASHVPAQTPVPSQASRAP